MVKWILRETYNTFLKMEYKDWTNGKICFNTFSPFSEDKKNTKKESNLAESTAIADATRFIVSFGRALLWKAEVLLLQEEIMYFQERVG